MSIVARAGSRKIIFLVLAIVFIFIGLALSPNIFAFFKNYRPLLRNHSYESAYGEQTGFKNFWTRADALYVPILVYHGIRPNRASDTPFVKAFVVEPQVFAKQMDYLKDNGWTAISFEMLRLALTGKNSLPARSMILTFDDGWENQYLSAFPILKSHGFSATFFVFTNAIGEKHFFTWAEIKEMDRAGMTIAAHTKSHPYLFGIFNQALLEDEIAGSKKVLEEHLGKEVYVFAYPFGEYSKKIIEVVRKAGFKIARASHTGFYHTKDDLFTLRSIQVPNSLEFLEKGLEH